MGKGITGFWIIISSFTEKSQWHLAFFRPRFPFLGGPLLVQPKRLPLGWMSTLLPARHLTSQVQEVNLAHVLSGRIWSSSWGLGEATSNVTSLRRWSQLCWCPDPATAQATRSALLPPPTPNPSPHGGPWPGRLLLHLLPTLSTVPTGVPRPQLTPPTCGLTFNINRKEMERMLVKCTEFFSVSHGVRLKKWADHSKALLHLVLE